jgi:hypothetical protein
MALSRVYEDYEVGAELKRLFADIRTSFDLPFVPTIFKLAAGIPEYLKLMWDDLGPVARSRDFQTASKALEEFVRSLAISGGWRFADQQRVLSGLKFSQNDIELIGGMAATFARALPRMVLFSRLMQRGYGGGQRGRVSNGRQAAALARLVTVHVPRERDAGLRTWLIYSDIKKTTGSQHVVSLFRVLSPFPSYMASVWLDAKKIWNEPSLLRARDEVSRRALGLLAGLPVKDHRAAAKHVTPAQWRDIEGMVDGFVRTMPNFSLIAASWQRSFPQITGQLLSASGE